MKLNFFILCTLFLFQFSTLNSYAQNTKSADNYLLQPTGQYSVGVKDFNWRNPDRSLNSLSNDERNQDHGIITVKIYYPTNPQVQEKELYNKSFIRSKQQEILNHIPNISKDKIDQLNHIKSFATKNVPIVKGKKFPVLILSPGGGCPVELYENFITELVSHGYIVVGINSQFTGETKNDIDIERKSVPFDKNILVSVYKKIRSLHNSDTLFIAMDLRRVGLLGHSIGGRVLADVTHVHPNWFQAAVTLDIGFDTSGKSRKEFNIPLMHMVAASTKLDRELPMTFELGKNNYLVVLSPNENNITYSKHMNFTDLSTLQYLPAIQKDLSYLKQAAEEKFDLKFLSHPPSDKVINEFMKPTYILIKQQNKWDIEYFKLDTDKTHPRRGPYHFVGGIKSFKGLNVELTKLSHKPLELISANDSKLIRKILILFQRSTLAMPLGEGNGLEITSIINYYMLQFFNNYLKNEINPAFNNCVTLAKNTYIKCGPGVY